MTHDQALNDLRPITLPTKRSHPLEPPCELLKYSEQSSLHRLVYPDGHLGWLVTDYSLICKVLTDTRFSAKSEFKRAPIHRASIDPFYGRQALPGWLVDMDPPDHTKYRRALSNLVSLRRMKELTPRIEQIVHDHLNTMEKMGPPLDLIEHFALPVPSLIICELLGVPYEKRSEFQSNSAAIFSLEVNAGQATAAMDNLTNLLRELVIEKRKHPEDDILSELTKLGEFNDEEIAGLGVLLLTAGHETSASMLGLGTLTLLTNPAQLALLQQDPTLIDNAVEELLRYITIFQFGVPRTPLEDVTLDGQLIKAGESLTLSLPAANRDATQFKHPNQLDIQRTERGHLAFGFGIHFCLGRNLARIEMQICYLELFRQFPSLRLAVPLDAVELNNEAGFYGIHRLPVAW